LCRYTAAKAADKGKGKGPAGEEEEEEADEEGGGGGEDTGTPWNDIVLGGAEDKECEKEEKEGVANVVTEGSRWAYALAVRASKKNGAAPDGATEGARWAYAQAVQEAVARGVNGVPAPPANADGLMRDLNWRRLLKYEDRTVGAIMVGLYKLRFQSTRPVA
jgi:hypothetical protein